MIVDFAQFKDLIDNIGGDRHRRAGADPVEQVRLPVRRCRLRDSGRAGASRKGRQHMDGQSALIYSRIRENQLDPARHATSRAAAASRRCCSAAMRKLLGFGTFVSLPFERQEPAAAARNRPVGVAIRPARLGAEARRRQRRAPLPARRDATRRAATSSAARRTARDRDVSRALGAAAAAARLRACSAPAASSATQAFAP